MTNNQYHREKSFPRSQQLLPVFNRTRRFITIFTTAWLTASHLISLTHLSSVLTYTGCPCQRYTKMHDYVLVPKSFIKFMFSTVYRVTQKDFYARQYTSMWAPAVARQMFKWYSSSCHVFISMWGVISSTASTIRSLKSAISRTFLLYTMSLINPHAKKSNGVKSRDLGALAIGPPLQPQRPGKVSSRNVVMWHRPAGIWNQEDYEGWQISPTCRGCCVPSL